MSGVTCPEQRDAAVEGVRRALVLHAAARIVDVAGIEFLHAVDADGGGALVERYVRHQAQPVVEAAMVGVGAFGLAQRGIIVEIGRRRDVFDRAAQRIRTVERALRSVQDFDSRQIEGVDRQGLEGEAEGRARAHRDLSTYMPTRAAELRAAGRDAADRDEVAGRAGVLETQSRNIGREILEALGVDLIEVRAGEGGDLSGHVLHGFGSPRCGGRQPSRSRRGSAPRAPAAPKRRLANSARQWPHSRTARLSSKQASSFSPVRPRCVPAFAADSPTRTSHFIDPVGSPHD